MDTASRQTAALPLVLSAVAVAAAIAVGDLQVAILCGIYALLVIGQQPAFGRLGLLSFAQAAFFGLGAYASAGLTVWLQLPLFVALPAAIVLPLLAAAILCLPRLDPPVFPLVTLAASQLLWLAASGIAPVDVPVLGNGPALAITVWALALLGALFVWRMAGGAYGCLTDIARENVLAASAAGIDARRLRQHGFGLSAAYGGAAGALWTQATGTADASAFGLPVVMLCYAALIVGGRAHVTGAIAGTVMALLVPAAIGLPAYWAPLLWALAAFAALVRLPDGLVGALYRQLSRPPVPPPPAPLPIPPRKSQRIAGPLLAARGITRRFGGIVAVDNVSLALQPGEILGLIGPNGSGKTTLINALSGFSPGDTGRVFLAGSDVTGVAPHAVAKAGLARSFQTPQLADRVSALDNVAASRAAIAGAGFLSILAQGRAEALLARARAEAMSSLTAVGLAEMAATPAGELPSAARRRVEIARALALDPLVVAFDEPSAGLDATEREALSRVLLSLAARGLGLIVVEHDVAFVRGIAQRLACLDAGRLIAIGPTETVIADPKVVAAYLGVPPSSVKEGRP